MAEARHDTTLYWVDPHARGVIPLDGFHVPRRLKQFVRREHFRVTIDSAFDDVIRACAEPAPGREETWINDEIIATYSALSRQGFAHSVECRLGDDLVGGLYGIAIGGAFFGESMFARATDASKVALVHLVARLKAGGYELLDTQFVTTHLQRFGAVEVDRKTYRRMLDSALSVKGDFYRLPEDSSGAAILQSITQTS